MNRSLAWLEMEAIRVFPQRASMTMASKALQLKGIGYMSDLRAQLLAFMAGGKHIYD